MIFGADAVMAGGMAGGRATSGRAADGGALPGDDAVTATGGMAPTCPPAPKRALIALSGGVDSSVAAYLALQSGYDCTGVTMRLFDNEDIGTERDNGCCSLADVEDARSVCNRLGIPYYVFNFTDSFAEQVIGRFIAAYEQGATPNPCIDCNRFLKFDRLLRRVAETGCDYLVTGHYVRRGWDESSQRYLLRRGLDPNKDQSYVLYALTQEQLAHSLFPLGGLTKQEVRTLARQQGFVTAEKRESQDICFVSDRDYGRFIRQYSGREYPSGNIVDVDNAVLGRHQGVIDFTIGQRKGIGVAAGQPLYVKSIDPATDTVVVGTESELYCRSVVVEDINLIACEHFDRPQQLTAKHRYRSPEQPATVTQLGNNSLRVDFDEPQKAVTKGQALVLYHGDLVIGGGTITTTMG